LTYYSNILVRGKMKKIILLIFFLFSFSGYSYANVAMPGFWNVGAGKQFIPVYKNEEDSVKKIRMDNELVAVYLYPNFAVVRGEYNMYNPGRSTLSIHVGYPENAIYQSKAVANIITGKLEYLKAFVDNKPAASKTGDAPPEASPDGRKREWHIFQADFKPGLTKIRVYYMVDTHAASLRKGYDNEKSHGFSYILESGRVWGGKIMKGRVFIKLQDDLSEKDIIGLLPEKSFKYEPAKKILIYDFAGLEPSSDNNIVIRYSGPEEENFSLEKLKPAYYYSLADQADNTEISSNNLSLIEKNNFNVFPYSEIVFIVIIPIILAIPVFVIFLIVRTLIRLIKLI
jgi:hypothetical protein